MWTRSDIASATQMVGMVIRLRALLGALSQSLIDR
jgi:hypothetical protein